MTGTASASFNRSVPKTFGQRGGSTALSIILPLKIDTGLKGNLNLFLENRKAS
jgi:hypothetical protein